MYALKKIFPDNRRTMFLAVLILGFAGMFAKLGDTDLQPIGSCTYASISREMARTGDYLTPHWPHSEEFVDFYHHPPLFFWLQSSVFKIAGADDFTARTVSAFFGFLLIPAVFLLGRETDDEYTGFLAALTLILTPFFFKHSRKCELESIFVFFTTVSFLSFIAARRKESGLLHAISGAAAGLAFLSKGVPAGAIYASIIPYLIFFEPAILRQPKFWLGPLAAAAVAAAWIAPQIVFKGDAFWRLYVVEQVIWKISGGDRGQAGIVDKIRGVFFYLGMFLTRFFPWVVTGFMGAARIIRLKAGKFYILLFWAGVTFAGFSAAGYREDYYLLMIWPAWCVLSGYIFNVWTRKYRPQIVPSAAAISVILAALMFFAPIRLSKSRNPDIKALAPCIAEHTSRDEKVIIYKLYYWDMISLLPWYADRGVTHSVDDPADIAARISSSEKKYFLMKKEDAENLEPASVKKLHILCEQGRFVFASNRKSKVNPLH
jgi:4-amino-4-deoxy-L-arabinose transferase-like glycosyltransferase